MCVIKCKCYDDVSNGARQVKQQLPPNLRRYNFNVAFDKYNLLLVIRLHNMLILGVMQTWQKYTVTKTQQANCDNLSQVANQKRKCLRGFVETHLQLHQSQRPLLTYCKQFETDVYVE